MNTDAQFNNEPLVDACNKPHCICLQVDAYRVVYVAPLQFMDGEECIHMCSCMESTWEILGGLDFRSSCVSDCIKPGEACQHSRAVASMIGDSQLPSSPHPCSTLGSLDFSSPVQLLSDSGRKILLAVDSGAHPCDKPSTLGVISSDSRHHYKCLVCKSYSCEHICSLMLFLEEDEEASLSLDPFSPHPTLGPTE